MPYARPISYKMQEKEKDVLTMKHLVAPFLLLAIDLGISTLVFIAEISVASISSSQLLHAYCQMFTFIKKIVIMR